MPGQVAVLLEALTICHQQFNIVPLSIAQDMGVAYRMLLLFEELERTEWMIRWYAFVRTCTRIRTPPPYPQRLRQHCSDVS